MQKILYQVPNNILKNEIIILKNHLIFSWSAFVQICKPHGYYQYKMKKNVINFLLHINKMQLVLPHLPYDETIIYVFLKWWFEYKSPYKLGNVHPNLALLALKDFF